jgi:two-component system chemotaxis response regulator CheB
MVKNDCAYRGSMPNRDIIVIGGSAGSIDVLKKIVRELPSDIPAAVFVIVHLAARSRNFVPEILQKATSMLVVHASEGAPIRRGTIYVAPADRHLVIGKDHIHLSRGPNEGLQRPSINFAFRSAAAAYGPRAIGVLLSGMLDDGAAGIWEIARREGVTIVQDPSEVQFPSMPLSALNDAVVHYTLTVAEIAPTLTRLINQEIAPGLRGREVDPREMSRFTGFTCPECRGPLYDNDHPGEFRCRVGHVMSIQTLFEEDTSTQERKMYEAIVALQEGADLAERMAGMASSADQEQLPREAEQLRSSAEVIRKLIEGRPTAPADR